MSRGHRKDFRKMCRLTKANMSLYQMVRLLKANKKREAYFMLDLTSPTVSLAVSDLKILIINVAVSLTIFLFCIL